MKKLWDWLNGTGLGRAVQSYVKVFVSVVLGLFLADGANVFSVDASDVKLWLAAGLSSVLPLILTALNPKDGRFGIKPDLVKNTEPVVEAAPVVNKIVAKKTVSKKVSE